MIQIEDTRTWHYTVCSTESQARRLAESLSRRNEGYSVNLYRYGEAIPFATFHTNPKG